MTGTGIFVGLRHMWFDLQDLDVAVFIFVHMWFSTKRGKRQQSNIEPESQFWSLIKVWKRCETVFWFFFWYLLSSKPFRDTISAFSSPTVWLSSMRLVEDEACRKATSQTHTHTHKHTPAPFRSRAGSRPKVNTCLSTGLLCSTRQFEIIKTALLRRKKHTGYKVNKYGECKCQKPHVFVSQIIRHHNNLTTARCWRQQDSPLQPPLGPWLLWKSCHAVFT